MIIGLTGTIGAGKSTASLIFADLGYKIIDCDKISHGLNGDADYVAAIAENFGDEFVSGGCVDRARLAAAVFSDGEKLVRLENIAFPFIEKKAREKIAENNSAGADSLLDAPTLFRSGLERICDVTVGIIADTETRIKRIMLRGGISEADARARIKAQPSSDFFRERCDFTVENDGSTAELTEKINLLIKEISARR